jgi:hypothetical protein
MIKVLKQALEALELCTNAGMIPMYLKANQTAITSLRQAIAELESQEPFCYVYKENGEDFFAPKDGYYPADAKPLYTHPPQRTWVGLTDDELCDIWYKESLDWMEYGKAIEAKLKERNI